VDRNATLSSGLELNFNGLVVLMLAHSGRTNIGGRGLLLAFFAVSF
jgi:hypothetical protein